MNSQADAVLELFRGVRLTPTQRRIAHSLLQHSTTAAFLSASELAELARVSQPSVTRFAMALGYPGYPALRRRLREVAGGAAAVAGTAAVESADGTAAIGSARAGSAAAGSGGN
ncbi:MAG TPA: transcriptional regulator, partial [Micromonosporaceae bacterium]